MGAFGDDSGRFVPAEYDPESVIGYLREAVQEGDNFLCRQYGYAKADLTQKYLMGEFPTDVRSADLSQVIDNEFGSIGLQLQAQATDTKPFWLYTTENDSYNIQAAILNGCAKHWWLNRQIDMRFRDSINGALAVGSAAFWTVWDPWAGPGGDFVSRYIDARDALPVRPWSVHSYQDCDALVIRQERPTSELRRRWASMADQIRPDRDGQTAMTDEAETYSRRVIEAAQKSPFRMYRDFIARAKAAMSGGAFPVTDLYTAYLHDPARNDSGSAVLMGPWSRDGRTPLRNWSYRVEKDGLLYPHGRTIVATSSCRLYDGPNNYWHSQFPVSKLTLLQWPFERCYLGKSPLWDLLDWQKELNESQRAIGDHMRKFVEPDVVVDQTSGMSKASAEKIRTRKAGGKFFRRAGVGKAFEFEYPPPLPAEVIARPDQIISRMRSLAGTVDMQNILNKGQIAANETLDSILDIMTGGVRCMSRTLEAFIREVGGQMAYNFCQYYTKPRRLRILGARGASPQDYDLDPNSLVPLHVGSDYNELGHVRPERLESPRSRRDRAAEFIPYISFDVAPNSMLQAAHLDEELKYFQNFRAGTIDLVTYLEHAGFTNIGHSDIPDGDPGTIIGRLLKMQAAGLVGQVSAAGRKASGQSSPMMKSSGAISEST